MVFVQDGLQWVVQFDAGRTKQCNQCVALVSFSNLCCAVPKWSFWVSHRLACIPDDSTVYQISLKWVAQLGAGRTKLCNEYLKICKGRKAVLCCYNGSWVCPRFIVCTSLLVGHSKLSRKGCTFWCESYWYVQGVFSSIIGWMWRLTEAALSWLF